MIYHKHETRQRNNARSFTFNSRRGKQVALHHIVASGLRKKFNSLSVEASSALFALTVALTARGAEEKEKIARKEN